MSTVVGGRETTVECGVCDVSGVWASAGDAARGAAAAGVGGRLTGRGAGVRPPYTSAPRAPRLPVDHAPISHGTHLHPYLIITDNIKKTLGNTSIMWVFLSSTKYLAIFP